MQIYAKIILGANGSAKKRRESAKRGLHLKKRPGRNTSIALFRGAPHLIIYRAPPPASAIRSYRSSV